MQEIGHAALAIIPSFDGFESKLESGSSKAMLTAGASGGRKMGSAAGDEATKGITTKITDWSKKGAIALGGAAGFAVGYGLREGLAREAIGDKVAASLGLDPKAQQQQGKIAGSLYAHAFGESYEDVANAVAATTSSLPKLQGNGEIRRASRDALNFAAVFDVDIPRAVSVASTIINSKLAPNAQAAFDLLTRSSQKVPVALREDILDAAEEYGQFFHSLGYDGPAAFDLLVAGSKQGMYGIDKAGDAIKEFTIRSTDMSTASKGAYAAIGLDAEDMATKILKGGDDAQAATQQIIDGLLGIESPSARANAAIALFGTPIEDLNVSKIPAFLKSLQGTKGGLDDVKGAAERMGDTLNDNTSTKITALKRKLETNLVEFMSKKGLPALESFSDFLTDDAGPALRDFKDDIQPVTDVVKDLVGAFGDLPSGGKVAALGGVLAGGLVVKHKLGGIFDRGGPGNPMFVVVTNPGAPGSAVPGKGGLGGLLLNPATAFLAQAAIGTTYANNKLNDVVGPERASAIITGKTGEGIGAGLFTSDDFAGPKEAAKQLAREQAAAAAASDKSREALRGFWLEGKTAKKVMEGFVGILSDTGNYIIRPRIDTSDITRAISAAQTLNSTLASQAQVERGADGGVNYQHGGTGSTDGRFNAGIYVANQTVVAHDYKDFTQQSQRSYQAAGLGGVG